MSRQWTANAPLDGQEKSVFIRVPRGAIVGIVDLVEIERADQITLTDQPLYHWILENARRLPATPWRGHPSLFDVPEPYPADFDDTLSGQFLSPNIVRLDCPLEVEGFTHGCRVTVTPEVKP